MSIYMCWSAFFRVHSNSNSKELVNVAELKFELEKPTYDLAKNRWIFIVKNIRQRFDYSWFVFEFGQQQNKAYPYL